ncbi:hypothetical protein H0H93_003557, partial [Arthromyces matolae]
HPEFEPDFSDGSEVGYRAWYKLFLFPGSGDGDKEMTYDNHNKRVHFMYKENDIQLRKITHAGRSFTATEARKRGATSDGVKALGLWAQGFFRYCYDRAPPLDAMLAAAFFNGKRGDSYCVSESASVPSI